MTAHYLSIANDYYNYTIKVMARTYENKFANYFWHIQFIAYNI